MDDKIKELEQRIKQLELEKRVIELEKQIENIKENKYSYNPIWIAPTYPTYPFYDNKPWIVTSQWTGTDAKIEMGELTTAVSN